MSDAAAMRLAGQPSSSGSSPRVVNMRGTAMPLDLLMVREDPKKLSKGVVLSLEQTRQAQRDADWAGRREHMFAGIAAAWHIGLFAVNLAFWGFEGTAPDRYWPDNPRIRLQLRPGRYGNLEGGQRINMDYLARVEGVSLHE